MKAKTARASKTKAAADSKKNRPATVAEYLRSVPQPARATLEKLRASIRAAAPAEAEEVISYGIPAFRYKRVLVWFAAFSKHCSFFPTASVIQRFRRDLAPYRISKGTIQFPIGAPLPATLLRKMVKARVAELEAKSPRPSRSSKPAPARRRRARKTSKTT